MKRRTIPMIIAGIEKEEKISGESVIVPNLSLKEIPNINNKKPNQKIAFPY